MKQKYFDYSEYSANVESGTVKNKNKAFTPLLISTTIKRITSLFINTFFVAYLTNQSINYIKDISIYFIIGYAVFGIVYLLSSFIVDRTNRITMYRVAIIFNAIFISFIVLLGQQLVVYAPIVGIFFGINEALYWSSFNVLKNEMVKKDTMHKFSMLILLCEYIVKIGVPILLGIIIDFSSFYIATYCILAFAVIQIISSFFVKSFKPNNSSFNLKEYWNKLKEDNKLFKQAKIIYLTTFLYAFTIILNTLVVVITIMTYKTNINLGILTSIFSAVAIIILVIFKKITTLKRNKIWLIITAILPILGTIGVIVDITKITIVIYQCLTTLCLVATNYLFDFYRNMFTKENNLYDGIAEHHAIIESLLNIGRVMAYSIMFVVSLFNSIIIFKILLLLSVICIPATNLMLIKYEKFVSNTKRLK